jgi:outer membrane usher protein
VKCRHGLLCSSASLLAALALQPIAASQASTVAQAAPELQDALLSVVVNGSPASEPVALLRDENKRIYAPVSALAAWRLRTGLLPAVTRDGTTYCLINVIAGVSLEVDEVSQTLTITASPELLETSKISYPEIQLDDRIAGGTGGFVNYDVSAQLDKAGTSIGGAFEAGIFTRNGVGVAGFIGRLSGEGSTFVRLDTNWTFDDPARLRSIRMGDSISRGGVGGVPVRFGGIQIARNFAVQPGFISMPLPGLRGSAAVPSVVDVYVSGAWHDRRDVPPGPFEIADVPIVAGNGDVRMVVRDMLGRETIYSHRYYAAPTLLRRGLHDYSYEAGFLRRSFGRLSDDYGAMMLSGTHRYGFSDTFTGEAHAEATKDIQTAGVAGSMVISGLANIEASFAASKSQLGEGVLFGLSLERRTRNVSFGARAEIASDNHAAIGWTSERRPPASTFHAFAGVPVEWGSLGFSYLRRNGRTDPDVEYASADSSFRLGELGSLHVAARKSFTGDHDFAAEISLVMGLGSQTSASVSASLADGDASLTSMLQRGLPLGKGFGYQMSMSTGAIDRLNGKLMLQTDLGAYDAQLSWVDGKTGVRMSTAGGLAVVDGEKFASRQLNQSFATVKVGDYPGVRVYADNQLVGRTNSDGVAVVPRLRPYDSNVVRIELADLPMVAEIAADEKVVRPYNRHGVQVNFDAKTSNGAIIRVLLADGSPLPAGALVWLNGEPKEFASARGGEVYLTGLKPKNVATASWSAGSCKLAFLFTPTGDSQPKLGDVQCRASAQ